MSNAQTAEIIIDLLLQSVSQRRKNSRDRKKKFDRANAVTQFNESRRADRISPLVPFTNLFCTRTTLYVYKVSLLDSIVIEKAARKIAS